MTSEETLGRQFKTLYRGLAGVKSLDEVDFDNLGQHWTSHMEVADDFASTGEPDSEGVRHGLIITAKVRRGDYEGPNSLVGVDVERGGGSGLEGDLEHTLYRKTPIHILKVEHRRSTRQNYSNQVDYSDVPGHPAQGSSTSR